MSYNSMNSFRWYLKKAARKGMAMSSLAFRKQHSKSDRTGACAEVRVLTYHRFGSSHNDPVCVTEEDFEAQMSWIARHNLAISLADLEKFLAGKKVLPSGSILVTVDDGCRSLYQKALPILQKYAIPAVAFITVSEMGNSSLYTNYSDSDSSKEGYMSWSEVKALVKSGISIASHGWTHRSLGQMSREEITEEAMRSRQIIEDKLGLEVTAFAYPFGTRADFNELTGSILKNSGYKLAFTSQHGAIRQKLNPLELPRIKVERGESLWMFRSLLQGGLDNWKWIDRLLWQLQQSPADRLGKR